MSRVVWFSLAMFVCAAARAEDAPGKAVHTAIVHTIDDQAIHALVSSIDSGKITLATDPPRVVPLEDVERIEFSRSIAPTGGGLVWIGQDNKDLVRPANAFGGNGIQDLHLHVSQLKPLAIKQIVVQSRLANQQVHGWRLDAAQAADWVLAIERGELATEAELYLEPPPGDCFGHTFEVSITFADGSNAKSSTVAGTHTNHQLRVDRGAPARPGAAPQIVADGAAEVLLFDQSRLLGNVTVMDGEHLTWRLSPASETGAHELTVPLVRVRGVWLAAQATAERAVFDKQIAAPESEDVVFVQAADKTTSQLRGAVVGLADDRLRLKYQNEERGIKLDRVQGIVFAAHPKLAAQSAPYQMLLFNQGNQIAGHWRAISAEAVAFEPLWGGTPLLVPLDDASEIRFRNGRAVSLADLDPAHVEETPYFGRTIPWRRDRGFDDGNAANLKIKGREPSRAIAVHARCVLTYDLDEAYTKLKTTVGFDDSSAGKGRVLCRVLVDGREAFRQADLRADGEPQTVDVPLVGARQLTLEVDFGEAADIGDRVVWADPRLFRRSSAQE